LWSGQVKLVKGPQTYLLNEYEELWNKDLAPEVEQLLALNSAGIDYIPSQGDGKGGISYQYKQATLR